MHEYSDVSSGVAGVKQDSEGMLPEYVVFHELVLTSKQYMRTVTAIDSAWLRELAPHFYAEGDVADKNKKKVKGRGRAELSAA
jgi:pre-mRNA-splicing factor ATP-dependent RNA helicase DHX16